MSTHDVIVVGGGPAGSAAAYFLASAGADVLVLEKKYFPRAKTCGDGLTPRSVKVMRSMGLEREIARYQPVRGLRVLGMGRTMEIEFPKLSNYPNVGYVKPRKDLDSALAAAAMSKGAVYKMGAEAIAPILEGSRVTGVRWATKRKGEGGGVTIADEGFASAPITVIADGASSSFGRALGIRRTSDYPMGLAIRTYYRSDRDKDDLFESWLELRKGDHLLPGYGWIFPVADGTVNIGVGLLTTFGSWRNVNLSHLQRDYVDMLPKSYGIDHSHQVEPYKSGRLPMAGSMLRPYGDGYVVLGDAAGMVNPFNGEGIAYALETGKLAAGVVADALQNGRSTELVAYREALHDTYGAYYRIGRKFTKIIGRPKIFRALCQVGMRSQTVMEFVFQVLANLGEAQGGGLSDRTLRAMCRLAEQDLSELKEPEISAPTPAVSRRAGAA